MSTSPARSLPAWLILLFVAMLALGTDEFVISGILPAVADDLEVTAGQAGYLVTAFALAFCLGSPVLAVITDRVDKKRILIWGLMIFALANAFMVVVDIFWLALALRVAAGLAAAAASPTAMAIAGGAAPDGQQGRYLAVATSGLTVALFTGVPAGALIGDLYSWRATFGLIAVVAALAAVAVGAFAPSVAGGGRVGLAARLTPVSNPHIMALVGAMFLCGTGGLMFYNYLGAVFETKLDGTSGQVTAALLLVGIVGVAAVFFGGALTDKTNPRTARAVIVGGHAVALLALAALLTATTTVTPALFVAIGIWSIFAWALSPAIQAGIMAVDPQQAMLALALAISGLYGGSALGAAIGGYLVDNHSASAIPLVGAAVVALAWLLTLPARRDAGTTTGPDMALRR
ncbi:MFS transporter [Nocardia grenadensis]